MLVKKIVEDNHRVQTACIKQITHIGICPVGISEMDSVPRRADNRKLEIDHI
jgi:hypothetical protein